MKYCLYIVTAGLIAALACGRCSGQIRSRLSSTVAFAAMNNSVQPASRFQSAAFTSNSYITNIHDIVLIQPAYTASVGVSYGIPGQVFFEWINFHRGALAALSDGPGPSNNPNYLSSDVPALLSLAYNDYVNPSAYGARTLYINVQQWNGNLNWYSSTSGGGQFIKNYITWIMPIKGTLQLKIQ